MVHYSALMPAAPITLLHLSVSSIRPMMRATMSLAPPARNETIECTGRDGYVSVRAADVTAGSMATLAAEVRNLRRGNFMVMLRELEHLSSAVNLTLRAPQTSHRAEFLMQSINVRFWG